MRREPSSSSLVMVGTVHRDPKGFEKAPADPGTRSAQFYYRRNQPLCPKFPGAGGVVSSGGSEGKFEGDSTGRRRAYRRFLSHGEIQGIFFLLKVPFEWGAAELYARKYPDRLESRGPLRLFRRKTGPHGRAYPSGKSPGLVADPFNPLPNGMPEYASENFGLTRSPGKLLRKRPRDGRGTWPERFLSDPG